MFKLKAKSLATKLIAVTGGAIALVMLASNAVLITETRERVSELVYAGADTEARAIAADIAGDIGQLASAARSMAGVIERGHAGGHLDRREVVEITVIGTCSSRSLATTPALTSALLLSALAPVAVKLAPGRPIRLAVRSASRRK